MEKNSGDLAILNRDDPIVMQFGEKVKAKKVLFSLKEKPGEGAFSNGQTISLRLGKKGEEYSLAKTPLKGIHNVENMMASLTAARIFGCSKKSIQKRVKHLILIGEAKERMNRELGKLTDTVMAKTMEEAVLLAHQKAKAGEVVLLSPACSSFDMFKDYKERGMVFKEAIKQL